MQLYSTKNSKALVSFKEAVLKGLPDDNGLFMPEFIPVLSEGFLNNLSQYSFKDIALEISGTLLKESIPEQDLEKIIGDAINFPAPVVALDASFHVLELFHGPSLAFKDFGARFMARTMSYFNKDEDQDLIILVATSGDTGGAVAAGFYNIPGIKVVILYPSGKVSHLQEKQLTTLGNNISALEIQGTFDDCQALVKKAFLDKSLTNTLRLSSANSINIARLIPQAFYYFEAYKQVDQSKDIVFTVPSGNFGNLTAGLLAKKMGLNIAHFIAATNVNKIVPHYLETGNYAPKPSISTISNAMDVGNPSNFARMLDIYSSTWNNMKESISGFSYNDQETKEGIMEVFEKYNYIIDPHGAIACLAFKDYLHNHPESLGIILETAHPAKFLDVVKSVLNKTIDIPERLASLVHKEKQATLLNTNYQTFKNWLIDNY